MPIRSLSISRREPPSIRKFHPYPIVVIGLVALIVTAGFPLPGVGADVLHRRIDTAIRKARSAAKGKCRVGARILRVPQGNVIYSLRAEELFKPASNMKLVTTAAAIDFLGHNFVFRTRLALCGDDLLVVGDGDPGLGDPRLLPKGEIITSVFHRWAEALKREGLDKIAGDLIYDDSIFERAFVHPSWDKSQLQNWYAAPVGGLNFNDNCIDVQAYPSAGGQGVAIELKPRVNRIEVINRLHTHKGRPATIRRTGSGMTFELRGRVRRRINIGPVAVADPGLFFADALRTTLAAKGIPVDGTIRHASRRTPDQPLPEGCRVIAEHETPLSDILHRANKDSQNLFAECLMKRVGYAYAVRAGLANPIGSYENGNRAVRGFLSKIAPDAEGIVIADGSGLSHENRLTPTVLTNLLWAMYANPDLRDVYVNSLAIAGVDGTLERRMKDIAGKVHAKTGYISGVRPLSGYVEGADGQWYCFSVMFDSIKGSTGPMNTCHNEICRILATWKGE